MFTFSTSAAQPSSARVSYESLDSVGSGGALGTQHFSTANRFNLEDIKSPICLICHSLSTPPLRLWSPPKSGKCFATLSSHCPFILNFSCALDVLRVSGVCSSMGICAGSADVQQTHTMLPPEPSGMLGGAVGNCPTHALLAAKCEKGCC